MNEEELGKYECGRVRENMNEEELGKYECGRIREI